MLKFTRFSHKFYVVIAIILVLIIASYLYWYHFRRIAGIRRQCLLESEFPPPEKNQETGKLVFERTDFASNEYTRERINSRYRECLARKGLRPEDLFSK